MFKLKLIFNDLIAYVYPNHPKFMSYNKFYIEMIDKNMKSKHGDYNMVTHHIRVFNLYRDDNSIVATSIHELAHHIDNMNRGNTDHSKVFYNVFQELLYGALDMNLFSKEEFLTAVRDASDSNKIAEMIKDYVPKNASYKEDIKVIEVLNAFDVKSILKSQNYHWNNINRTWEKECGIFAIEQEEEFLKKIGVSYNIRDNKLHFSGRRRYIIAEEGSYEKRKELALDNFRYHKEKKHWFKEGNESTLEECRKKYPSVTFHLK